MLDRLLIQGKAEKDVFTDSFVTEHSIVDRKLANPGGRNLSVLFPPWHGGGNFYERLINRLTNKGDAVLAYYLHDEILKPDAQQVKRTYGFLSDTIATELMDLTSDRDYNRVRLIAMSLGNPLMSMVSTRFQGFDSAYFVTNSSSLAKSAWHGIRTQHIRAGIEHEGFDLTALEEMWKEMAPLNHLEALAGKDVEILLSKRDKIIPSEFQYEFLDGVSDVGIKPRIQETSLGHYATIGRFCVSGDI